MEDEIEKKIAQIKNYTRIVEENRFNRWYWKGRRRLDELEQELKELYDNGGTTGNGVPPVRV